jgi:AIR synthase-related protein
MSRADLLAIAASLLESTAFRSKGDIARVASCLDAAPAAVGEWREKPSRVFLGDDTAAIPDGDGYLLLAAEGILPDFVERDPYFAGWSSVMVNVNDVAAMGGHPLGAVDVCFHAASSPVERIFAGVRDACRAYGVPLVGGHTTRLAGGPAALVVAILGRARHLLTSFGALPGDVILLALDLRGRYRLGFPFWNATEGRSDGSLRGDLALLQALASTRTIHACKDVSNAGIIGTTLMMLETSGVGGVVDLARIPRPAGVELDRWLVTFPSYGFLFAVRRDDTSAVEAVLRARDLTCEVVGRVDATSALRLAWEGDEVLLWDLREQSFTGFGRPVQS